jgi:hypothetical protein
LAVQQKRDLQAALAQLTARLDEEAAQVQKVTAQLATASPCDDGLEASKSPQDESAAADLRRKWSRTISKAAENLSKACWSWGLCNP